MSLYDFEYVAGKGLKAEINKEDLADLMRDEKQERVEQDRRDEAEAREETRSDEEQGYRDSGMSPSDFM